MMLAYIRGYIGNGMLICDGALEKEADVFSHGFGRENDMLMRKLDFILVLPNATEPG